MNALSKMQLWISQLSLCAARHPASRQMALSVCMMAGEHWSTVSYALLPLNMEALSQSQVITGGSFGDGISE